ncbi:MAG: polymer-forming cytoskeletal protein [Verrucomicrobiales bacterium]|jgi:cytoskeletal protein CcmA (bactofilin family)|nr:polymer-forming cytoskeletal protein [Verrucomicrobiales bacterium]
MSLLKKLFKPRKKAAAPASKARLVQLASAGPLIRGELYTKAAGYFGCELEGDLRADQEVWIEPSGVIRGNLQGSEFHIEGSVQGHVTAAEAVTLTKQARVTGNINARSLSLEAGARFNGLLVIGDEEKNLSLNLKSK